MNAGERQMAEAVVDGLAADPIRDDGSINRNIAIAQIKGALQRRSGKAWSVTGGRGTAWGWLSINTPPSKRPDGYNMTEADALELAQLLGVTRVSRQGESVPASSAHYREYIRRANGLPATVTPPYWD
jgi:hypothetical protein